jgi:Tol biopolymer transport system component
VPSRGAAWSPDGRRIVFERAGALWIVPADGADTTAQRVVGAMDVASFPDWSPNGRWLVYGAGTGTETSLAVIAAEGGTPRRLMEHAGSEWFPRWSPDRRRVAFYSTWNGEMTDVWTIDASGANLVRATDHAGEDFRAAWSPDGMWLAFTSTTLVCCCPAARTPQPRISDRLAL